MNVLASDISRSAGFLTCCIAGFPACGTLNEPNTQFIAKEQPKSMVRMLLGLWKFCAMDTVRRLENRRYSRLESLRYVFLVTLLVFSTLAGAQEPPKLPPPAAAVTNSPIKQISPNVFEIGKVRFDKAARTVTFPAALNMNAGLLEYVVVTATGKIHESLVRTEAEPYHIHLAMLLLGAKGAGTNTFPDNPALPIPGELVNIQLSWKDADGKEQKCPAEDMVLNQRTRTSATRGPWVYNGSRIFQGTFIAQQDGSIVSLMTDPDALINNPRPGREDDTIWEVLKHNLPPLNSPMQVTIQLEPKPGK